MHRTGVCIDVFLYNSHLLRFYLNSQTQWTLPLVLFCTQFQLQWTELAINAFLSYILVNKLLMFMVYEYRSVCYIMYWCTTILNFGCIGDTTYSVCGHNLTLDWGEEWPRLCFMNRNYPAEQILSRQCWCFRCVIPDTLWSFVLWK